MLAMECEALDYHDPKERYTPMECTYFPNAFFTILNTALTLMFIYCRYKSIVAKLIILQKIINYIFLYFVKY
jgi:hypothetical protein